MSTNKIKRLKLKIFTKFRKQVYGNFVAFDIIAIFENARAPVFLKFPRRDYL